jgi:hypothetical protein
MKQYDILTHNELYEKLQTEYFETRDSKILGQMYSVAKDIAYNYIKKYCNQRGLHHLDIEEKSHDAALFVIEQYLRKPQFRVERISAYIYFGTRKALFKDKDRETLERSYEEIMERKENKNK